MTNSITFEKRTSCHYENHVLSRSEAQSELQRLTPGSCQHTQLQQALTKTENIVEVVLPYTSYKVHNHDCRLLGGFGSSEHMAIGKAIKLKGLGTNAALLEKGSTNILFEHIIPLAGDIYGIAGKAISLIGGTDEEKTERFIKAYETLENAGSEEISKIIQEVNQEFSAVNNSSLPHHCYSSTMMGRSSAIRKIKSDIDDLLIDNSDHFAENARDAYLIGHTEAMRVAKEAGKNNNIQQLKRAYAMDAFACHFLTDLFAAGHNRNQRGALEVFLVLQLGFPLDLAKKMAGLLTGAQHEKDGDDGLDFFNKKGETWRAYGDGHFFTPKNKTNMEKCIAATQQSVDEVFQAYSIGSLATKMRDVMPWAALTNPPPLYSLTNNTMFLHQGSQKIEIKTKADYLYKGLSQAVQYLPQGYIDEYLSESFSPLNFEFSPMLTKVVAPQVERFTGVFWHVLGLASYHQMRQSTDQLNSKIEELSSTVQQIYNNTENMGGHGKTIQPFLSPKIPPDNNNSNAKPVSILEIYMKNELFNQVAFGGGKWDKYYGSVKEPPPPKDIEKILRSPCPLWSGKNVEDIQLIFQTHFLFLMPKKVNLKPYDLNVLREVIVKPKEGSGGHASNFRRIWYSDGVLGQLGNKAVGKAYWVLIAKNAPSKPNDIYKSCSLLEGATALFMKFGDTGIRLFSHDPFIATRDAVWLENAAHKLNIGDFNPIAPLQHGGNSGLFSVERNFAKTEETKIVYPLDDPDD